VAKPDDPDVTAYAARVGLELGADIVKVHWTGSVESFRWVVESAGLTKVLSSGGARTDDSRTLQLARDVMSAGASGMAIGRDIWESKDPKGLSDQLREIIFGKKA
jgi:class I fructose-bisphosphate aldolase